MREGVAEIFQPVRRAHDVRVHHQRHDQRRPHRVIIELLKLIDRPIVVFAGLMMLDQHHRHVVAFLCVGKVDDRPGAGLEQDGLIIKDPVAQIVETLFDQNIRGFPGFGEAGAEPSARAFAGKPADRRGGLADVVPLVVDPLHALLSEAVADELPATVERGARDRLVSRDRRAVDREHGADLLLVENLKHPPEADPVAVFVPGPVRNVGHRRAAGRRGQHRPRHRLGRIPFLDIDNDPDRQSRAIREFEPGPLHNGRKIEALGRQHYSGVLAEVYQSRISTPSQCSTPA